MSIPLFGATGDLFNRLGKCGLLLKQVKAYQAAQLVNLTDTTNGITAQYDSEPDIQAIPGAAYIGLLDGGASSIGANAQQTAKATANRMVFRDNPRFNQTLTSSNLVASLAEIVRQIKVAGATVLAQTVTATPVQFSAFATNIGNGQIFASIRRPFDGLVLENAFAENLLATCSADSYSGGVLSGNESFIVNGVGAQTNLFAFNWPLGSNGRISISAIDGSKDNASGNILTNSGFDSFTANAPDSWTIVAGTAGGNIFEETSLVYGEGTALRLLGDGTTNFNITQEFGSAAGTTGTLSEQIQYGCNFWLRRDGVAPGAGTLTIDLIDGSGTVIQDANSVDNTFDINLTALTTTYTAYSVAFRMPIILPSSYSIRIRLTAGLTAGRSVYLDRGGLGQMSQVYVGGPFVIIFSGSTPFVRGDYATVAITNSRGAAGTLSTWQTAFYQLFAPEWGANEFLLPSSGAPTISDSLIG